MKLIEVLRLDTAHPTLLLLDAGTDAARMCDAKGLCNLRLADASIVVKDTAKALSYNHGKCLVHADIKPANLVWNPVQKKATVIDFELAAYHGQPHGYGGTPFYLAPEIASDKQYRQESDVWALGICALFVFRYTPLPDKQPHWNIARGLLIRGEGQYFLKRWLGEVEKILNRVPIRGHGKSICAMLDFSTHSRITAAELATTGVRRLLPA